SARESAASAAARSAQRTWNRWPGYSDVSMAAPRLLSAAANQRAASKPTAWLTRALGRELKRSNAASNSASWPAMCSASDGAAACRKGDVEAQRQEGQIDQQRGHAEADEREGDAGQRQHRQVAGDRDRELTQGQHDPGHADPAQQRLAIVGDMARGRHETRFA